VVLQVNSISVTNGGARCYDFVNGGDNSAWNRLHDNCEWIFRQSTLGASVGRRMNTLLLLGAGAAVGILLGLGRQVSKPLAEERSARLINNIEDLLPLHSQHLPQLRQSLASADTRYLRRRTSDEVEHIWREERRQIVARFLKGVAADFARIERLAIVVDSLAPEPSKRDEAFRAWIRFRFRILYRAASRWIAAGMPLSTGPLVHLTNLVANLSAYAENAMNQLEPR